MKMVYSNKQLIYFSIFGIVLFSIANFVSIFSLIKGIINNQSNLIIVYSLLTIEFICIVSLLFLALNRLCYKIIYNEEERTIERKGFICGYKYILK